jgi:hypothetical protein
MELFLKNNHQLKKKSEVLGIITKTPSVLLLLERMVKQQHQVVF